MLLEPFLIVLMRGLHLLVKIWQAKMHLNPLSSFWGPAQGTLILALFILGYG